MPVLLNDENTINTTISQPETINTSLPDINYIPGYKEAEAERRANEVVRQSNEADRIALYEDIEHKVETGYFDGEDGFSPVANVIKDGNTATITITDKIGTTTASIFDGTDGTDGQDGQDGFSPTATVTKSGKVATITITDKDGTTTAQIRDGEDGQGAGDMLKSTYDTNDNGIVDNAEKVNNHTVGCDVPADAVFTDTTYTAGTNVSISAQNVISATDTTYTAGTGIEITNGVISNTQTSAEWGNIKGDIEDQTDLKPYLDIVAGDSEETTEKASSFTETGVLSLKDYSIYGDTSQSGTPTPSSPQTINNVTGLQEIEVAGKNLLDNSKIIKGRLDNGVVGYKSNTTDFSYTNNSITFTTDAAWRGVVSDYIKIKPNTDYIYSAVENLSANTYQIDVHEYDSGKQWIKSIPLTREDNTVTFTSDSDGEYIRIGFLNPSTGEYTVTNPMVEIGTQATTYEPYIGKQYEINLGKNLVEPKMSTTTQNGITCTKNDDGSYTLNGTASAGVSFRLDQSTYAGSDNLKTYNGTYTLSCNELNSNLELRVMQNQTWTTVAAMSYNNTPVTFTTNINNCFTYIYVKSGATINNITIHPQLEKGSQATSYSPYKTPIELCKIGTYQDYIYKNNNKWYLHKEIGKVVLDGSENWQGGGSASTQGYKYYYCTGYSQTPISFDIYCDKLNPYTQSALGSTITVSTSTIGSQTSASNNLRVIFDNNIANSLADFKTWLTNNKPEVYYILKNLTDTEITDTELIEQLNKVELLTGLNQIDVDSANKKALLQFTMYTNTLDGKYNYLNDTKAKASDVTELSGQVGILENLETNVKSTIVNAINEIVEKFNFSYKNNLTVTLTNTQGTQPTVDATINSAYNNDGSIGKIYGYINLTGAGSGLAFDNITIADTGLRPSSDITLLGCALMNVERTGQQYITSELTYTLKTNGTVTLDNIPTWSDETRRLEFIACLIFANDFGDVPIPPQ